MGPVAMLFGVLLTSLGLWGYFGTDTKSMTALIPAFVGAPLFVLGLLALQEHLRKHAMHAAAALGLLGFLGAGVQFLRRAFGGNFQWTEGTISQAIMAVLCGVFVGLCVKSFIDARRAQAQRGTEGSLPPV